MSGSVFFWYVLPFASAAVIYGWVLYDRAKRNRLHPR
jgi:hypothetical protein